MYSMTAYSCVSTDDEWGRLVWECRSVNHRYLDITFRMPEIFHSLENKLREEARSLLRGRVDCFLAFKPSANLKNSDTFVDFERIKYLINLARKINEELDSPSPINVIELLGRSDIWIKEDTDVSLIEKPVLSLFSTAISNLSQCRLREGNFLKNEIQKRIEEIRISLETVRIHLPELIAEQRKKLVSRFEELELELDVNRLEQEMIYLIQKMDVAEEIDRLFIHLIEIQGILETSHKDPIGRRLDFLMQELNREVNTLGSKTSSSLVTKIVVDLKVLIEQIREQVQNVV